MIFGNRESYKLIARVNLQRCYSVQKEHVEKDQKLSEFLVYLLGYRYVYSACLRSIGSESWPIEAMQLLYSSFPHSLVSNIGLRFELYICKNDPSNRQKIQANGEDRFPFRMVISELNEQLTLDKKVTDHHEKKLRAKKNHCRGSKLVWSVSLSDCASRYRRFSRWVFPFYVIRSSPPGRAST